MQCSCKKGVYFTWGASLVVCGRSWPSTSIHFYYLKIERKLGKSKIALPQGHWDDVGTMLGRCSWTTVRRPKRGLSSALSLKTRSADSRTLRSLSSGAQLYLSNGSVPGINLFSFDLFFIKPVGRNAFGFRVKAHTVCAHHVQVAKER